MCLLPMCVCSMCCAIVLSVSEANTSPSIGRRTPNQGVHMGPAASNATRACMYALPFYCLLG